MVVVLVVPQASTLPVMAGPPLCPVLEVNLLYQDPLLTITAQAFLHSYFIFPVHFLCGLSLHLTEAVSQDVAKDFQEYQVVLF